MAEINKAKPKAKAWKLSAGDNLQLRIATDGTKTWLVRYFVDAKERQYTLPQLYGSITDNEHINLADARLLAAKIKALARQGVDYAKMLQNEKTEAQRQAAEHLETSRIEAERAAADDLSLIDMAEAWLANGVRRQDGNAELLRSFKQDLFPVAGTIPVRLLGEMDLRAVFSAIIHRGANRTAVIMRNNLMQMFTWAGKRQPWRKLLVEGNPIDLIDIENIVDPDYDPTNERKRVLAAAEVTELHKIFVSMQEEYEKAEDKRATKQPIAHTTRLAIWIMLSTMCRIRELTLARWEDIDFQERTWLIPKPNVKGRTSMLLVHLSEFALAQFQELHKYTGAGAFCFPSRDGSKALDPKSITKQVGNRQAMFKERRAAGYRRLDNTLVLDQGRSGDWTPHDLRRTGATMMQALRVDLMTIDRCQNHVLPGSKTRRHYLHYDYAAEKSAAWDALGRHLQSLVSKQPLQWWQRQIGAPQN